MSDSESFVSLVPMEWLRHPHCENCFSSRCSQSPGDKDYCPVTFCQSNCGASFHECKSEEHNLNCPKAVVDCINAQIGCPVKLTRDRRASHLKNCPASLIQCPARTTSIHRCINYLPTEETDSKHKSVLRPILKVLEGHKEIPRKSYKVDFPCDKVCRREEYPLHFQNVHADILSGLDWLEHCCPLVDYGCQYTLTRLCPIQNGAKLKFNKEFQGFGVIMPANTKSQDDEVVDARPNEGAAHKSLCDLPWEILQHIMRMLDGFTLNNISLTCHLLRDVCHSVLNEKGMVVSEWIYRDTLEKRRWYLGSRRWQFSTCSPIASWQFNTNSPMAQHLRDCPFNAKLNKTEPYLCMLGVNQESSE